MTIQDIQNRVAAVKACGLNVRRADELRLRLYQDFVEELKTAQVQAIAAAATEVAKVEGQAPWLDWFEGKIAQASSRAGDLAASGDHEGAVIQDRLSRALTLALNTLKGYPN